MYRLANSFTDNHFAVVVVGCGGTGGYVAEGLCRLLPPKATLILVDHDVIEEHNLLRQNFTYDELGLMKSAALAKRLSTKYRREVAYSTLPIGILRISSQGIVIGCVDNGIARREISNLPADHWWIDAGNGENYGQILIGGGDWYHYAFDPDLELCHRLPSPALQRPELLLQQPPRRDCAQATAEGEQGPVINQIMAALVLEVTRRLLGGTCSWMQVYVDLELGSMSTVPAAPETVSRLTGTKIKALMK